MENVSYWEANPLAAAAVGVAFLLVFGYYVMRIGRKKKN
jgi:hypothetical protein